MSAKNKEVTLLDVLKATCNQWVNEDGNHGVTMPFLTWVAGSILNRKPDVALYREILYTMRHLDIKNTNYLFIGFFCDTIQTLVHYIIDDDEVIYDYKDYLAEWSNEHPRAKENVPSLAKYLEETDGYYRAKGTMAYADDVDYVNCLRSAVNAVKAGKFSRQCVTTDYDDKWIWAEPDVDDAIFLKRVKKRLRRIK